MQYTIMLTDAEDKALAHIALSQEEWISNVVRERCRVAIDEIVASEVKRLLDAGQPITGSRDDIVMAAQIETAAQARARVEAEVAALQQKNNAAAQATPLPLSPAVAPPAAAA